MDAVWMNWGIRKDRGFTVEVEGCGVVFKIVVYMVVMVRECRGRDR